ncbi:hypothetical protein CEXT_341591 [Caerostris extrusa]|uniref:Uncharacterized protein n=1 Tax=Caerostris extrusa TaxID=172846 RepID=A0AAV4SKX6_CAEEX|nr:hypothetical protein CEXT_341591 [Caerostris extrusa]
MELAFDPLVNWKFNDLHNSEIEVAHMQGDKSPPNVSMLYGWDVVYMDGIKRYFESCVPDVIELGLEGIMDVVLRM